jgi:RNA polymerase sigma factor (sigma-70 family)
MPLRPETIRPVFDRLASQHPVIGDAEALRRYRRHKDEQAFAQLVQRYGPLVTGVCRRLLGSRPEADDAVQATFWTLARKAGSIREAKTLPAWLHSVAYRTARKVVARLAPTPEHLPIPTAPDDPLAAAAWGEVRRLLDEEVHRLPSRLRLPILLCYFEDLTRDEAAERLGWSLSTVKRRLDQARDCLRARLLRRGVGPGLLAATTLLTDRLVARMSPALEAACTQLAHQPPAAAIRVLSAAPPVAGTGKWLAAVAAVVGLGWGIVTLAGQGPVPDAKPTPGEPKEKQASSNAGDVREPLPARSLASFGTTRYRSNTAFWFGSFSRDGRWFVSGTEGVELWDLQTGLPRQLMSVRNNTVPRPTLSPDGALVAVLDGGPGIHLFDRQTGKELRTLGDAREKFDDCRFSPDGKRVVATTHGEAPVARGFDIQDGKEVFAQKVDAARDHIVGVWDGRNVFILLVAGPAAGGDRTPLTVRVVDAETGKDLRSFDTAVTDYYEDRDQGGFRPRRGSSFGGNRFAVADDLSHLAYLRADASLGVVALQPGSKPRKVELPATGSTDRPFRPSRSWFAPDGKSLFASDHSGVIVRCDTATGKVLATFPGHRNGIGQWHFDPGGKVITTAGQDGHIRRWDLTTNREVPLAPGFRTAVQAVFSADGTRVVVGDKAGTIDVFAARTGKRLREVPRPSEGADWCNFALSPDGRVLAATRPNGTILWWDVVAGKEVATVPIPGPKPNQVFNSIDTMAFSPDGRRLACGYPNGGLSVVDTGTHKELWRVGFPADVTGVDYAKGVAFSADGRYVARSLRAWDRDGGRLAFILQVVDAATGRQTRSRVVSDGKWGKGDVPDVADLRYTPDGRYLAVLSRNGKVQLLHSDTLAEVSTWMIGSRDGLALNVSPDGRTLLTGDETGTTRLWEVVSGKAVASISGHRGHIASAAISPDGRLLLTGGYDQVAYVWGLEPNSSLPPDRSIDRLAGDNAEQARAAVWAIANDPDGPRRLRERFKPIDGPKPESIREWIGDLDHPTFARREAASAALSRAAGMCEPALHRALQGKPSAEARERLVKILAGITRRPSRDDVSHARAVQAMELANTEAARKVLEEWAAGTEGAWLTVDARAALERLRARAPAE